VNRIYLDHNATTPLRVEVQEAMGRVLRDTWGNPSSVHAEGAAARAVVEEARDAVAALLNVEREALVFTGGATESNNTALLGVLRARGGRHVVTTAVEHPSVDAPLEAFRAEGGRVTCVPVDAGGRVSADAVLDAVEPETALVSVIWANNETGVVQPIEEIAERVHARGIPVHSDATQALGKLPIDLKRVPLDLLSLSAHKFNGPKGVGCLVARSGIAFEPLLRGGPQEGRRRGGTENVASIAGLGVACALAADEVDERRERYGRLRDRLWQGIEAKVPHVRRNGDPDHVLANTLNVEFEGAAGELVMQALDLEGVSLSAGAACASGSVEPSPVLVAMGATPETARGSLRFSVGHGVDEAQIDHVLLLLPDLVERARAAGNS
jgi:cysteine desulfurase